jgi:hypothetical protein
VVYRQTRIGRDGRIAGGSLAIGFFAIASSQTAVSAISSVFGPAIAAISLGIVGHGHFAARTGRNEAFNQCRQLMSACIVAAGRPKSPSAP